MNNKFENENEEEKLFKKSLLDRIRTVDRISVSLYISKALYSFACKFSFHYLKLGWRNIYVLLFQKIKSIGVWKIRTFVSNFKTYLSIQTLILVSCFSSTTLRKIKSVWFTPRASSCSTLSKPLSQSIVDIVSLSPFNMWPPITMPIATSLLLSHKTTLKSFSFYSYWTIPRERCLQHWEQDHSQQQLRNSGMAYLWSFVKQHHLTVLNLDLKPIFLRSIFIVCNLVYFILTVIYFRFLLNIWR